MRGDQNEFLMERSFLKKHGTGLPADTGKKTCWQTGISFRILPSIPVLR
jgi:hypothetical protein